MPDLDGNTKADEATTPDTSLHGYKEGRKDDIKGDADKLESNDPADQQVSALEGDDELKLAAEKK
ncbi:MAG: hypothetical protein M3071_13035 [Actinomycetota bacterium]|nr:hypothetical protein [Actinomycetota bacterium]